MKDYLVLVTTRDSFDYDYAESEETAMDRANSLMESDSARSADATDVAIYQLVRTGKRQPAIAWEGKSKTNGATEPPRPAYQGANTRWSDDEVIYLKEAKDMGMSFAGIAKKLGRSKHAVELKYSRV